MLRRDDDCVDAHGTHAVVFDRYLRLAIGPQPGDVAALARGGEHAGEVVREHDGQRHQFGRLAAGVAEHHALVAGAGQLESIVAGAFLDFERTVDAERDVGRLLVDRDRDAARFGVEADLRLDVADVGDRRADDLGNVDVGLGRDLARDVDLARDCERFDRDAAERIVLEDRVEHRVGNLVGDLVGMTLGHRFAGEQTAVGHDYVPSDQEAMYFTCSGVSVSMPMFIAASFNRATSSSMCSGTG